MAEDPEELERMIAADQRLGRAQPREELTRRDKQAFRPTRRTPRKRPSRQEPLGGLLTLPKSCRKLAVQLSLSFEEEMKMTIRTWMTMKVYRVCPQKSRKTRLKTVAQCQTLIATAATVTQKQMK
jgi:hypothetical protein